MKGKSSFLRAVRADGRTNAESSLWAFLDKGATVQRTQTNRKKKKKEMMKKERRRRREPARMLLRWNLDRSGLILWVSSASFSSLRGVRLRCQIIFMLTPGRCSVDTATKLPLDPNRNQALLPLLLACKLTHTLTIPIQYSTVVLASYNAYLSFLEHPRTDAYKHVKELRFHNVEMRAAVLDSGYGDHALIQALGSRIGAKIPSGGKAADEMSPASNSEDALRVESTEGNDNDDVINAAGEGTGTGAGAIGGGRGGTDIVDKLEGDIRQNNNSPIERVVADRDSAG